MNIMTQLPDFLQPFRKQAEQIFAQGLVGDIEFSGETYQIQVTDPRSRKEVWTFLQLDRRGGIKDCFCSCEEETDHDQNGYCPHLAAAFLRIYNGHSTPLHERFQQSLWNQLCHFYADLLGDDPDILECVERGFYRYISKDSKSLFSVKAKNTAAKALLKKFIDERQKETESTSLKFSNLPEEEILSWQQGRPSPQLKYDLSYWNDLAHWLMQLQENSTPYTIRFNSSQNKIPNVIYITFPEIEFSFDLPEESLPYIIPSLSTVNSPLTVHEASQEAIKAITYDNHTGTMHIESKEGDQLLSNHQIPENKNGIALDGWLYVPGEGFYAKGQHDLLMTPELSGDQISDAFSKHRTLIKKFLKGTILHSDPVTISYNLSFDSSWNLHLIGYMSLPGDMTASNSRLFGSWVYLDGDGFYPVGDARFGELEKVIPSEEVGDFVYRERDWLNLQEGFHTHLSSIEMQLTYSLGKDNRLSFAKLLSVKQPGIASKDFGMWVYVVGQGFFAKGTAYTSLPVSPDVSIHANHISYFIRENTGELQIVSGFFSEKCPVLKAGLLIELTNEQAINITPQYELFPEYRHKDVRFFEDYVYVTDEGFHELPADSRLPERFRHPVIVEPANVALFLTNEFDSLQRFFSEIDPLLIKPNTLRLYAHSISKEEEQESERYILKLSYQTERGFIYVPAIWAAIKQKKRFLFDEAGRLDLSEKRFNWIKRLHKNRIDRKHNTISLTTLELIRLHALEDIVVDTKSDAEVSNTLLRELTEFKLPEEPDLTGMRGHLRPYQQIGVHWLWFLYRHKLSGLLCDEMGLGKTHQAMALLTAIVNTQRLKSSPKGLQFLVVCPTSVMYHWEEKLQEYLPNLRICTFYGSNRNVEDFKEYDLILTSYGIWRLEHALLSKVSFEVAIFDEIQIAKNHNSRIHASLLAADCKMRIGLTGTPVENHLRELKALFDLVLPNYMPDDADYRDLFVKPIEREGDQKRRDLLTRFIKPFVMRRKKAEVLPDLPEKTEEISHCNLHPDQQHLYTQVLQQSRSYLIDQLQDPTAPVPYMHIFALLSALKQICDHPAVFLKQPDQFHEFSSGKWDLFVELLNEARESQQKVVVFTQYLAMLDIFEQYLDERRIKFATIRGATLNRGDQIHRFNQDPKCEVFLGSLQAAGLGVDLTGGSVVIHYDRWWNAARENQATDRVHRIGQTRGVQVFKLVTKGTFEERIDALITKKGRLMEDVITSDDHRFMKAFDRAELLQLLQDVEETKSLEKDDE